MKKAGRSLYDRPVFFRYDSMTPNLGTLDLPMNVCQSDHVGRSRPNHHARPPGLDAWLLSVDATKEPSVRVIEIDGTRCVIKRRRASVLRGVSYVIRYIRASVLAVGCKVFLGEFPSPRVLLRNGLPYEAERLKVLDAANLRVPLIWAEAPGMLALEYVGDDMPGVLRRADPAARRTLARAIARDLAEFHQAGFSHGGAQVRNLICQNDAIWRIDFEENIGEALSLPLAQAYDVYQCIASITALRGIAGDAAQTLGDEVLRAYLHANDDAAVRLALGRFARLFGRASTLLRPLFGKLPGRDIQGFFRTAHTLGLLFKS